MGLFGNQLNYYEVFLENHYEPVLGLQLYNWYYENLPTFFRKRG